MLCENEIQCLSPDSPCRPLRVQQAGETLSRKGSRVTLKGQGQGQGQGQDQGLDASSAETTAIPFLVASTVTQTVNHFLVCCKQIITPFYTLKGCE